MKKFSLLMMVFFVVFSQSACKDEDDDDQPIINETAEEVSFVVNGGSAYNGKYVTFTDFNSIVTKAYYNDTTGLSHVKALGQWDNANAFLEAYFPDDTLGYYFMEEPQPPLFEIPDDRFFSITLGNTVLYIKYMNFHITAYGKVGEHIKGTFNGQVYDFVHNPAGELININNGKFSLKRTQ